MRKFLALCLCLILLLPSGCAVKRPQRYQAEFLSLFDTVTVIVGYSESKALFTELAGQVQSKLQVYHELYDIYHDYEGVNNIKTINDNAGIAPVVVDRRIISMLLFAKEQYIATDGKVNVTLGSVLKLWHDYREAGLDDPENAALPPEDQLKQAAAHTNINDMIIDEEASTVYLRDPLMRLDVGAVAKGYAAGQVILALKASGVNSLLLSIGGNVCAIGGKPAEIDGQVSDWAIGVQNPDKSSPNTELATVMVSDLSVVSSGIYERYYTVNGVQYHHIIDPDTLMPSDYFAQVTIICPDSGLADALSTAVFNMPLEKGLAHIEALPDVEALWVLKDGTMVSSSGFDAYRAK